jgi:putative transposase
MRLNAFAYCALRELCASGVVNAASGRRYWEHLIRDTADFQAHMDYVHINPVKHGLVERVVDWPFSTFHELVERGVYLVECADTFSTDRLAYDD